MKQKRSFTKLFMSAFLSLTIAFAGTAAVLPQQAQAATYSSTKAHRIINFAERFMGRPYNYGATVGNTRSFDCSSFTKYVYGHFGIKLPRTSREQSHAGRYVKRKNLRPGDLVFFYSPVHHVAIYIGNGKILHTYGKPGVTISKLNSGWWDRHYTTARRVIG